MKAVLGKTSDPHRAVACAGRQESADSVAAEVEKLLGRLADGLLLQDRQEAVVLLCELLQNNEQV